MMDPCYFQIITEYVYELLEKEANLKKVYVPVSYTSKPCHAKTTT